MLQFVHANSLRKMQQTHGDMTNKKIRLILNKLLEEYYLYPKGTLEIAIRPDSFLANTGIDRQQFLNILANLEDKGVIESVTTMSGSSTSYGYVNAEEFALCRIEINKHFEFLVEMYTYQDEDQKDVKQKVSLESGKILYLEKNGDLWHGDRKRFCYKMDSKSPRFAILKYLVENKGAQDPADIALAVGKNNAQAVRTEVNKIREKIKQRLDLDEVIKNGDTGGYEIGSEYTIYLPKD